MVALRIDFFFSALYSSLFALSLSLFLSSSCSLFSVRFLCLRTQSFSLSAIFFHSTRNKCFSFKYLVSSLSRCCCCVYSKKNFVFFPLLHSFRVLYIRYVTESQQKKRENIFFFFSTNRRFYTNMAEWWVIVCRGFGFFSSFNEIVVAVFWNNRCLAETKNMIKCALHLSSRDEEEEAKINLKIKLNNSFPQMPNGRN